MRLNPLAFAAGALALLLAAGCETSKKATPKEQATKQWNAARASVLTSLANDQYKSGNFDKCRQTVDEALRLVPENPNLHILSAKLHIEQGQLEAAERALKTAREFAPNDAQAHYLSGVVYQRWQKPEAALEFYKAAAAKSPAELAYWLAQAEMLVAMDRPADALALLQGRADYFEHSGTIRDAVGQLHMQFNRYGEAAAAFRQASILSEDDHSIRERLALALYLNRDWKDAAEVLARLVQNETFAKRADLFVQLGEAQLHAGRAREARVSFDTATQLDPQSAAGWRGIARSALETGDLKRAELSVTRSIKVDPTVAETHLLLGYVRVRQNRLPEARRAFEHASLLDPKDAVSLCMIGYVLEKTGQSAEATQYYAKALRLRPGDAMASQLMAGVDLND